MNKLKCLVLSPLLTKSGYGHRSLDLCRALLKVRPDWDIYFISQRWGSTPFYILDDEEIMSRVKNPAELKDIHFDVSINITVPNEFRPYAKYNIGVSAGVETSIMPAECLMGMNSIDLNIMSSNHSKNISESSGFEGPKNLKLEKPITILLEGVNTDVFNRSNKQNFDLSQVKEDFCFLMSGMWLQGDFTNPHGHDRKHIATTIKVFLETFKEENVGLILKVGGGLNSFQDKEDTLKKIDAIRSTVISPPNIYLIHGDLSENELVGLYQHPKVKGLISVGNEGWNRVPLEFSAATSKPMIMSPFSGHLDYLNTEFNLMVGGSLEVVHPSSVNNYIIKESSMFYPNLGQLGGAMVELKNKYPTYEELGKRQGHLSRTNFSLAKMQERLDEILTQYIPKFSQSVPLVLPKLEKHLLNN